MRERTDLERRQALCRAIFLLDDESFRNIEIMYEAVQRLRIEKMTGEKNLPLCFDGVLIKPDRGKK